MTGAPESELPATRQVLTTRPFAVAEIAADFSVPIELIEPEPQKIQIGPLDT